ncbi:MAG: sulfotransferase family 2 domain-containing protein [Xanthomonadales bacterium]|nr:sulfotransferase family 2 domain-containing protein [Xanthomonadales bacterium]
MLVSHRHRFIYTKTAKTASTSVEVFFEPFCVDDPEWTPRHHREAEESPAGIVGYRGASPGDSPWYNHMSALEIRDRLGSETWNAYLKFCVVRNPFDLLVSWFWFEHRDEVPPTDPVGAFREALAPRVPVPGRSAYRIDGEWCLDRYLRYENLEADIEALGLDLGLDVDPERLPRLKSGIRDNTLPVAAYYDRPLVRRVREAYAPEIERFSYDFPG